MNLPLTQSLESLYGEFAKYPASDMSGSPAYEDLSEWNKELLSKPLRELTENDLSRYVGKAMTTWGNAVDFKHFLPRILDLVGQFRPPYETDVVFGKIELADWKSWPDSEKQCLYDYWIALWQELLDNDDEHAHSLFEAYFEAIYSMYQDFETMLVHWKSTNSAASISHLCEFVLRHQNSIFDQNQIGNLQLNPKECSSFFDWLTSDQLLNTLQNHFFESENAELSEKISWVEQMISAQLRNHNAQ